MAVALACASFEPLSPGRLTLEPAAGGAAAVVGVVLFSSVAPDNFAVFDRAFLTLFYVTSGDPWPDALHKVPRRAVSAAPSVSARAPVDPEPGVPKPTNTWDGRRMLSVAPQKGCAKGALSSAASLSGKGCRKGALSSAASPVYAA